MNEMQLRMRKPGMLVPDILFNDVPTELYLEDKPLNQLIVEDARCDLLLIIGTSLQSRGAASVAKALAREVHKLCGAVVYVNANPLAPSVWAKYVDLYVQIDIEEWAQSCMSASNDVVSEITCPAAAEEIMSLATQINMQRRDVAIEPQPAQQQRALSRAPENATSTPDSPDGGGFRAARAATCSAGLTISVLFVIYHHNWAMFEAQVLGDMLAAACVLRGWTSLSSKEMSDQ
ncbi:hypothetical protein FRC10_007831 [Ceratobasidium sp. 414]|nr:hypothetical protein FRC10_007831 [Ceratobasidium sp. 414]